MASIRVRAKRIGYYDLKRRYPADHPKGANGRDVFELVDRMAFDPKIKKTRLVKAEEQFSENWMERVDSSKKASKVEVSDEAEQSGGTGDKEVI